MKTQLSIVASLFFSLSITSAAVTAIPNGLFVEGVIEGSLTNPFFHGDTIDYLTFEVTTRGPVRLIGTGLRFSQFPRDRTDHRSD